MMGHTKATARLDSANPTSIYIDDGVDGDRLLASTGGYMRNINGDTVADENRANAKRLADCWNAFEGIDDPAAFMRDVRKYFTTNYTRHADEELVLFESIFDALRHNVA